MRERVKAQRLSDEIDRLLGTRRAPSGAPVGVVDPGRDQEEMASVAQELEVASRLSQMIARLPPVPVGLERRVRAIAQSRPVYVQRTWRPAAMGALAVALVFLVTASVVWFVVPGGQQARAQLLHTLLGQTQLKLTPTLVPSQAQAVREPLRDLVAAELLMGRAPSLPKTLPEGYELLEIAAVSYPDLPSWISQPLYVELCYGREDRADDPSGARLPQTHLPQTHLWQTRLCLRQYRLLFRDFGGLKSVQVASGVVTGYEPVDVGGAAGMLLTLAPDDEAPQAARGHERHTMLWERDGLLHELEAVGLSREELLQVATSVR